MSNLSVQTASQGQMLHQHSTAAAAAPAAHPSFPPLAASLSATRIHNGASTREGLSPQVIRRLEAWLPHALACSQYAAVAVDTTNQRRDISSAVEAVVAKLDAESRARVSVVCVSPWVAFCPALNALLSHAQSLRCETILYSSLEMAMHPAHVHTLAAHLDASTLAVGARLGGHRFTPGNAVIDGCSVVWNTLALWNCERLARTGFLPVSDGVPALTATEVDPLTGESRTRVLRAAVAGGIEEVVCVSLQQQLFPESSKAKLLSMGDPDDEAGAFCAPFPSPASAGAAHSPAQHSASSPASASPALSSSPRLPLPRWAVDFGGDEERRAAHDRKMISKIERAQQQLDHLSLKPGVVQHIDCTVAE